MDTPIVIAIISSTTAIFVAVISLIYNSRNQKKSSIELEKVKMLLDIEKKNNEEQRKTKSETAQAIDLALECSQKIKDNISMLSNYVKFKNELTIASLESNRQEIKNYTDIFSKVFPKLDDAERSMLHDMKKHLHQVDFIFAKIIHQNDGMKNIDEKSLLDNLNGTRNLLTELQHELLVRKANYIQK